MSTVIQLLIVLGIMVLVHEFGHFAVAKLCGIRVEVFSIGFGKRLFGFRRGDTEYQISAIPLGGYVKMAGEMGFSGENSPPVTATPTDPGEFNAHPRWQRILVALAGPIANFILALGLMTGVSMLHNEVQEFLDGPAVTDYIQIKTPAAKTGIHSGDLIVHYDTVENPTWEDVANRSILNLNQTIPFSFVHDGQRTDTKLFVESKGGPDDFSPRPAWPHPQDAEHARSRSVRSKPTMPAARAGLQPNDKILSIDGLQLHSVTALLGLSAGSGRQARLKSQRPAANGATHIRHSNHSRARPTPATAPRAIASVSSRSCLQSESSACPSAKPSSPPGSSTRRARCSSSKSSSVSSPARSPSRASRAPSASASRFTRPRRCPAGRRSIGTMSLISINLGILNLLPIPILDGGMILFLLIETIMRRDVNQQVKERIYQVAFVCILAFFAFVIFNDLTRLNLFTKLKP